MAEVLPAGGAQLIARWKALRKEIESAGGRLLAISKYAAEDDVAALVAAGQTDFGESRPQQLRDRAQRYPDARWHMIGPLQKNKAKYIACHAAIWHSLEDIATARAVDARVEGRRLPVLVQVNMSGIAHRHGVAPGELPELVDALQGLDGLRFMGLMCMAPQDGDARACFSALRSLRDGLQDGSLAATGSEQEPDRLLLCMGMSGDFRIALEEGSDMVRLGSTLFGPTR